MSRQKNDRKLLAGQRNAVSKGPGRRDSGGREGFAAVIAAALREEFGHTGSAVKTVASTIGADERAVRNWFEAKNGPTGAHLVDLMQHSDRVLEATLLLSGHGNEARKLALATLCSGLRDLVGRIEASLPG